MEKCSVLFDFNNTAIRCLHAKDVITKEKDVIVNYDWDLWKLYTFTAIYEVFNNIKNISEIVLAVDSNKYWRKTYYPRYKEKRASQREKSGIDWDLFFKKYTELQEEIKTFLPIKVLNIPYTEGDDIIGTLCLNLRKSKKVHIISSDKDFLQLCHPNVEIYNPMKKDKVSHPNPEMFIQELCLTGQSKDNIPNIVTPTDWPLELRSPGFGPKAAEKAFIEGLDSFLKGRKNYMKKYKKESGESITYEGSVEYKDRFDQNRNLIDLKRIPESITKVILYSYNNYNYPSPDKITEFFVNNNWREYIEKIVYVEKNLMGLY